MKNLKRSAFFLSLLIMLLAVTGCENDNRSWTVIDHSGREFSGLKKINVGIGWSEFKTEEGKTITFRGNHTYVEE